MNSEDRNRILHAGQIKKSWGDLLVYLSFTGGFAATILYAYIFRHARIVSGDRLIHTIFTCSVLLSIAVVFLWLRTPSVYLLGKAMANWKTSVSHSLRTLGYEVSHTDRYFISLYKKRPNLFISDYIRLVVVINAGALYACIWKDAGRLDRDIGYSGKSEICLIVKQLYANVDSQVGPQLLDKECPKTVDSDTKMHIEFLHADNSLKSFKLSEEEAIKRTLIFPWDSELSQSESLQKVSPTVSLVYPEKKHVLWASVLQQIDKEFDFLVCLMQENDIVTAQADGIALSTLPELFHLFYQGDFEALSKAIGT